MIYDHLLDRVADVHKAYNPGGVGGGHRYEDIASFSWPCRVEPVSPTAQAQATGRIVYSDWMVYGNTPTAGEIEAGDKLVLEDGTVLRVKSVATHQCPDGEYLALVAGKS